MEWTALLWPPGQRRSMRKGGPAMKAPSVKPVRCAIYTRVSTEHGLDQEFNSLDAQYDAGSAYIKSQAHAGWNLIRSRYDDGGYSGGPPTVPPSEAAGGHPLPQDRRHRRLQGRPSYEVSRGLRQAGRAVRCPRRLICLGHPAIQHYDLDGPADTQRPFVLRPVRARGHLGADPRQDCSIKAKGPVGRRHPAVWL